MPVRGLITVTFSSCTLAGAVVAAPVAFLAVKGVVGLAVAATVGAAVVYLAPWVGMKLANLGLKAQKHEARTNPIETMQVQAAEARKRLASARDELVAFGAEVRNFRAEVREIDRSAHPADAEEGALNLAAMEKLLAHREASYNKAVAEADAFDSLIKRAAGKWKVAQSAQRISKMAGAQQDDAMRQILKAESLDSVQTAMNKALADPSTRASLQSQGVDVTPGPPQMFMDLITSEIARWRPIIQAAGIRAE